VPQEPFLLPETVAANLRWATPDASDAELEHALRLASAWEFVSDLPHGLDSVVGERGVKLSGGERQRIALARALLRQPTLLILDEATSALDAENERHIQRSLEQLHGQMTIFVIAHRLSTIQQADQILVLEGGQVQERGAWADLMAAQDGYLTRVLSESV
jgi:ATP-binding cassette subfamily C protein